jgi:hypothetical protein
VVVLAAVVLTTAGCGGGASGESREDGATVATVARSGGTATALQALGGLLVKGRAPQTGYDREQFRQAWADVDRNGCDTRNDVLRRDVVDAELKAGTQGCVVAAGTINDPYSGVPLDFLRGENTSSAVQIDHMVALSDAWQTGVQQLSQD